MAFKADTAAILPSTEYHTNIPDNNSHFIAQHKPAHTVSPLAKSLLALNVPAPARLPLSIVMTPLVMSRTAWVALPQKKPTASLAVFH